MNLSFDNTTIAFAHRTNKELKQAHLLFRSMGHPWLVKLGTRLTPWAIRTGLPVNGLIKGTIFKQFVGGETLEETSIVAHKLALSGVQVILDYGVEGKEGEASFDHARDEFIRVIRYAATQQNVPYISIKVTGFARFSLLEKMDDLMHRREGSLQQRYLAALQQLDADALNEWNRVEARMTAVCEAASVSKTGVLVDAEESWIQDPVDALTMQMMAGYNRQKAVVYNTIQLYRHDRMLFLRERFADAGSGQFILGAKIVRGAYMEKERARAAEKNYPSPIQPSKEATDRDYNEAVRFTIGNSERIAVIIATHNEESNLLAAKLVEDFGLPANHAHIHFSQLYGMSDHITYNLAKAGYSVSKYLPFGPISDVVPYLMRRAQENTSVGGQTSRELTLIKKELDRRKNGS